MFLCSTRIKVSCANASPMLAKTAVNNYDKLRPACLSQNHRSSTVNRIKLQIKARRGLVPPVCQAGRRLVTFQTVALLHRATSRRRVALRPVADSEIWLSCMYSLFSSTRTLYLWHPISASVTVNRSWTFLKSPMKRY